MAVPVLTKSGNDTSGWLKGEFDNHRYIRSEAVLAQGQKVKTGQILGKRRVATTAPVVTPGTNTGNGTLTMDGSTPVLDGGKVGTYRAICVQAITNGGRFDVLNPDGVMIGEATVGTVFGREIKFTINDGATDFVVGDSFAIAVASGTSKVVALADPGASDGTDEFGGIALLDYDASATGLNADMRIVVVDRGPCAIAKGGLSWGTSAAYDTEIERAPIYAQMEKLGMKFYITA